MLLSYDMMHTDFKRFVDALHLSIHRLIPKEYMNMIFAELEDSPKGWQAHDRGKKRTSEDHR